MEWVLVALLGVLAGAIAGLFGVGGGTVFVPTLTLILGLSQLHAQATSLLAIVPVAMLGSWQQRRGGHINQRDALIIGGASIVTAVLGSVLAEITPERGLRIGFAVLLLYTAWRMYRSTLGRQGVD